MRKCVLVICHSRAQHLENCLESVLAARGSEEYKVVLVRQMGFDDVGAVVEQFRERLDLVVEIDGEGIESTENIRRNRYLGYFACYQTLDCEVVLALEEDVQIAYDTLDFIEAVMREHSSDRHFRGINLGSMEPRREDLADTYSLLRYGIHGPASVLAKGTWDRLLVSPAVLRSQGSHFDSAIEALLKTGYMVTANNSRYMDFGYGGTHTPNDENTSYFAGLRASWLGREPCARRQFHRMDVEHHWRSDAIRFNPRANAYHRARIFLRRQRTHAASLLSSVGLRRPEQPSS